MTDLLTFLRKLQKKNGAVPAQYAAILPPVLDAIIAKMKYDETASWGEEDEQADEAEFQDLRRRLHVLQQTVTAIDEPYYIETLSRLVNGTFGRLSQGDHSLNWRDLELALYEMYLFGELAVRNQGLYAKREPSSVAAQQLVSMMHSMIDSGKPTQDPTQSEDAVLTISRSCELLTPRCSTSVHGDLRPILPVLRAEPSAHSQSSRELRLINSQQPCQGPLTVVVPFPATSEAPPSPVGQCFLQHHSGCWRLADDQG